MSVTVTSTTDNQASVNAAAAAYDSQVITPKPPKPEAGDGEQTPEPEKEQPTTPEAEPAEEEESPEEEEPEAEEEEPAARAQKKNTKRLLRKLSRLSGRYTSLQQEHEAMTERLRRLEGGQPQAGSATAPQGKPERSQFPQGPEGDEKFFNARLDYELSQRQIKETQAKHEQFLRGNFEDYLTQIERARESYEDFDDVVDSSAQVPVVILNQLPELENGAEVAYYLGKHPEVRERLIEYNQPYVRGGARKMLAELDRISEQLQNPTRQTNSPATQRPVSTAPRPIRPLGGASTARSVVSADQLPYREFKKWREENGARRR